MSNCKFPDAFSVVSQVTARLRQVNEQNEVPSAAMYSAAWRAAQAELEVMFPSSAPAPVVRWKQSEEPIPPRRPKCYVHSEWYFTFSDGTTISRCRHNDCGFGLTRKTHSDGTKAGGYFVGDSKDAVVIPEVVPSVEQTDVPESEIDEKEELNVLPVEKTRFAGVDEPEDVEAKESEEEESEGDDCAYADYDEDEQ